jgi:hypothetical protein
MERQTLALAGDRMAHLVDPHHFPPGTRQHRDDRLEPSGPSAPRPSLPASTHDPPAHMNEPRRF